MGFKLTNAEIKNLSTSVDTAIATVRHYSWFTSFLGQTCRMRAATALINKVTDLYVDDCLIQTTIS